MNTRWQLYEYLASTPRFGNVAEQHRPTRTATNYNLLSPKSPSSVTTC